MENKLKNSQSHIYSALLKHGHSNFSLTILEYCDKEKCIEREDYYLQLISNKYNILPKAGSLLGHTLSEEHKQKISDTAKKSENSGRFQPGENHPNYGKPTAEGAGVPSQKIEVFDKEENITTIYDSMNEATRALNLTNSKIISQYISRKQTKPYKNRYTFTKV
jgi:hypothetical protein